MNKYFNFKEKAVRIKEAYEKYYLEQMHSDKAIIYLQAHNILLEK